MHDFGGVGRERPGNRSQHPDPEIATGINRGAREPAGAMHHEPIVARRFVRAQATQDRHDRLHTDRFLHALFSGARDNGVALRETAKNRNERQLINGARHHSAVNARRPQV